MYKTIECVNIVVFLIPAALLIDRVGRRVLLLFGGILTAVSLATCSILLAIYLPTGDSPSGASFLIAVMTILLCLYRLFLSMSLHPLSLTVPTEIQPLAIRSAASAITTVFRNGSSFVIVQFALPLLVSFNGPMIGCLCPVVSSICISAWDGCLIYSLSK